MTILTHLTRRGLSLYYDITYLKDLLIYRPVLYEWRFVKFFRILGRLFGPDAPTSTSLHTADIMSEEEAAELLAGLVMFSFLDKKKNCLNTRSYVQKTK